MVFTTANVQQTAAAGAAVWSLAWLAAWLLAPLVEVPLVAVLRAEQTCARYDIPPTKLVRQARWALLGAGYLLNTWSAWAHVFGTMNTPRAPLGAGWDVVLQHSIPPLAVLVAVEVMTDLRDMFTRAVRAAAAAPRPIVRPTAATRTPAGRTPTARPPAPRPRSERPAPPDDEQTPPPPPPPADTRTVHEIGVEWALAHWDDEHRDPRTDQVCELRPVHVRAYLEGIGRDVTKGTHSKIVTAAKAERFRLGLPTGGRTTEDDTSEEETG